MAPYYPLTVLRSDGLFEVLLAGKKELNQPTPKQLDSTPDANGLVDYYRKVDKDDLKAVDWRRKLGTLLMRVLDSKNQYKRRDFILVDLPEGFSLWEHVKFNVSDQKKKDKLRNTAQVYERQDVYLYGHRDGPRKRYRSPGDFFPHLLWLATDKDGDNANCSCKICSPDGDKEIVSDSRVELPATKPATKAPKPTAADQFVEQKGPQASALQRPGPQAPLAQATTIQGENLEQKSDSSANSPFLYRPGELIWFNKGTAWGLAIISKRQSVNGKARYIVQPLSHPLSYPPYQIKDNENEIRPWLAWSVPSTTHAQINNAHYESVQWERVSNGEYGRGDAEVDGSILAAKLIDSSYTLFDRIEAPSANPLNTHYNGMFLGAEKIWVGEPVRLRSQGNEVIVMIVNKLAELTISPTNSIVTFIGDIYKFVEMPMPYTDRSQWPTPALPPRMVADLRFRNEVADNAKRATWYEWRLLQPAAKKGLAEVKGRWYESRSLLPILRGIQQSEQDILQGTSGDTSIWMNGRGDSNPGQGQRKISRLDTLGRAVPPGFTISRGLDEPQADNLFPDVMPSQFVPISQPGYIEGDIDQYMDLGEDTQNPFYADQMQQ
ncbi:hypothetical protein B7494_g7678 [Chlorociboria aeruginascens]|nr:hypothetical protein B7494_g7678 [Chlorociboria aeruginascens]